MVTIDYSTNMVTEYTPDGFVRHQCATADQMHELTEKILAKQGRVYGAAADLSDHDNGTFAAANGE